MQIIEYKITTEYQIISYFTVIVNKNEDSLYTIQGKK